ncbi:hypothetical protein SIL80_14425 [Bacillus cereus group sp. BfR-BA-01119]|uniref:Replication protein n=1 Tax=Bacillus cytotoxicus (strain DSM 22905 / CIP 110041 / 391-98 / NVH 391-98) TaxID=315749 RepID=A7GNA3_BACCN|nr:MULTISPECIES: hypothetical protein [Bacillus cereus group]KXI46182.1 hypothetical protein ACS95_24810 [Bacillus cereus]ABS21611.1 hypothetical protein Bcer98_1289 [Bacillus cytotoxicus NVH 391-98]AWC44311.1 hypothetical protein CG479_007140 [Bacillus cytotoxicus]MDA2768237.1 hypothetical protein [Bacillus cereus group sp. Bc010]MDH2862973.1 hypothetical protein [Bacillus cytotoxicus]
MLKMTTDNYIQIPNVAFGFGTEYKLNNDELKVFAYLQFMKNVGTMNIRTHVTIIVEDLGWTTSNASRDNVKAGKALEGLRDKGYITLSFNGDVKKNALAIEINDEMKKATAEGKVNWKQNPFKFKGFTPIKSSEYNLAGEDDYHLTVMAYHNWRNNAQFEYAICDKEWCEVLELGMTRTREIINDCIFLTKVSGKRYQDETGKWKQETNQYVKSMSVKTNLKEIETKNKNLSFLEREREKVTDENVLLNEGIFKQIFDKQTKFYWDGYKAWKETICDHVKQAGQKKIDAMLKSSKEGAKYVVEKLEKEYQERLKSKERAHRMMEIHMNEFEGHEEWTSPYKQKEIKEESFFDDM